MNEIYRAPPYKHFTNERKSNIINQLFFIYKKDTQTIIKSTRNKFIKTKTVLRQKEDIKEIKTILSERYKYKIYSYVVYPTNISYLENAKNYIVKLITIN